jgi:hypothetical protein
VYISHAEEGEKKRALCKKQSVKKKLPVGGGAGGKNALCKKSSRVKKHTFSCMLSIPSSHTAVRWFGRNTWKVETDRCFVHFSWSSNKDLQER